MHIHPIIFYLSLSFSCLLGFFLAAAFRVGRDNFPEK